MSAVTFTIDDPVEALLVEQARLFARELRRTADQAPDGQVIAQAERCVLTHGREFLRTALQTALQAQAEAVEKRGHPPAPAAAATAATRRGGRPNTC